MDMWALGVCVYMWVFGELPFTGAAPFIIYDKIRSQVGPYWGGGSLQTKPNQTKPVA
jgi:hypothetical protein